MANSEILDQIEKKIDEALEDRRMGRTTRTVLEVQSLFVAFFRQSQNDHERLVDMWPIYRLGKWVLVVLVTANIYFLFDLFLTAVGR